MLNTNIFLLIFSSFSLFLLHMFGCFTTLNQLLSRPVFRSRSAIHVFKMNGVLTVITLAKSISEFAFFVIKYEILIDLDSMRYFQFYYSEKILHFSVAVNLKVVLVSYKHRNAL